MNIHVYWICSNVSDLLRICFFNVRSHLFYILSLFFSIYRPLSCHIITLYYHYLYFEFPLDFSHSHTLLSTHHRHTSSPVLFHPYPTHPFSYILCTALLYTLFIFTLLFHFYTTYLDGGFQYELLRFNPDQKWTQTKISSSHSLSYTISFHPD